MSDISNLLGGTFRTEDVDTSDVIPEGTYRAAITGAEIKTSKAGSQYISIEFSMLTPAVNGRKHWENLNVCHEKEDVRKIAKKQLAKIMEAVGLKELTSAAQQVGKRLQVTLGVRKDANDDLRNSLKKVAPWQATQSAPPQPSAPAMPSVPDDDESPYWDAQQ